MLHPVIMAGGSGTRFWPKSRLCKPKQLIRIVGKGTMIQQTVARLSGDMAPESFLILTNAAQVDLMAEQLPQLSREQFICEPCGRDTAACVGLAAFILRKSDPDAIMAICAADHVITPPGEFARCIRVAARLAAERHVLVTFGVTPTHPSTGYGYVRRGAALSADSDMELKAFELEEFKEKPDLSQAQIFLQSGEYYWNSGNFVWHVDDIIEAIRLHMPELHAGLTQMEPALATPEQAAALERDYAKLPKTSIDFGVMEKAKNRVVIEASFEWDDVGAWDSVSRHYPSDADDNVIIGNHVGKETEGCIIVANDGHLLATIGIRDLIIVHTDDATLVCDRRRAGDVKALVELLKQKGHVAVL